ncbi:MAG: MBG domain-containing protein [Pyrinomonadaceae bacterium]
MTAPRTGHTATAVGSNVVITGGGTDSVEMFNGTAFTSVGTLTASRTNHSAAAMNDGRVFIAGGIGSDTAEIYNPADGTSVATRNPLAHARAKAHLRVLPDGKVQIIGGNDDVSMEVYDPAIDTVGAHVHLLPDTDTCTGLRTGVRDSQTRAALFFAGNADAAYDRTGHTITEVSGNQALVIGGTSAGGASNAVTAFASSPATITTDKLDYAPGETVTFTGTNFAPNETVRVVIHEDPHTHLERNFEATADASGNITGNYQVEEHDLNVKFIVNARGLTSNLTAQTAFTDARNTVLTFAGTGSGSVTITPNTGTVNAPVTCGGTGTNAASQTVTSTCAPNITTSDNGATVTFSASAAGGSTFGGWSGQTNLSSSSCSGTTNPCSAVLGGNPALTVTFTGNTNTTTSVASSANPSVFGQSLTLTATVARSPLSGSPSPTGSVQFVVDGTNFGSPVALVSAGATTATAATTASSLSVATHTVSATYIPTGGFNASNGSLTGGQVVNKANTTTTLTSDHLNVPAWTQLSPTGTGPSSTTCGQSTVADGAGRLIVYARTVCGGGTGQVWVLNSANGVGAPTWSLVASGGPSRHAQTVTYDQATNRLILFGGCSGGCLPVNNDVWILSNANGQGGAAVWTQMTGITGGPPAARNHAAGAYDPATNRLMIFGGQNGSGSVLGANSFTDVWVLTNANTAGGSHTWTQLSTTGTFPLGKYQARAFYDSVNNRLTIAGGVRSTDGGTSSAVNVLTNANGTGGTPAWSNLISEGAPGAPAFAGWNVDYNAAANRGILASAGTSNLYYLNNANGLGGTTSYSLITPSGGGGATPGYGLAFDAPTSRTMAWHLNGATNTSFVLAPASSSTFGDPVTFTATITVNSPGAGTATGFVQFFEGVNPIDVLQPIVGGVATVVTSSLNAGLHNITAQYTGDTNLNGSTSGILPHTVSKKTLTVTANNQLITYGDPDPAFTFTYSSGFVSPDTATDIDTPPTCTVSGAHVNVNTYPIVCTGGVDNNYDFTYVNGTLTIQAATLSVNAVANSKTYGDPDPALAYTLSGFKFSQDATSAGVTGSGSCSRTLGETVAGGPYTITCAPGTLAAANYVFATGTTANFTINARLATWTTNPASKTYGDPDPAPLTTGSGSNFVAADNVTATYSRVAGENASPPTYHITATLSATPLSALDNYTITNDGAEFTINKRLATWTTNPNSKTYGDPDPVPVSTGSGSNFVTADNVTATYSRIAGESASPPTYHITAALSATGDLNNYIITNSGAEFTINKRLATWNTNDNFKYYGDADPNPITTGAGGNFMTADNVTATYARAPGENVLDGPYAITATLSATPMSALNNYIITNTGASFIIFKAAQVITVTSPAPATAVFGQSFYVAATGGASGNPVSINASGACSGAGTNGTTVTMIASSGLCVVTYNQAGNDNYQVAIELENLTNAQPAETTTQVNVTGIANSGSWQSKAPMNSAPGTNGAAIEVVNGKIYVAGGFNGGHTTIVEEYDPVTDSWASKANRPSVQSNPTAGTVGSVMYVAGGNNGSSTFNQLWAYTPGTDTWTAKAAMPTVRQSAAGGVINNLFYVAGGRNGAARPSALEVYNPATNTWATKAPITTPRADAQGAVVAGKLYVFGGIDVGENFVSTAEVYDPVGNSWAILPSMPTPRGNHSVAVIGTRIYVIGGHTTGSVRLATVDVFDTVSMTWTTAPSLSAPRSDTRAAAIGQTVFNIGGTTSASPNSTNANESYTVASSSTYGQQVTFTATVRPVSPGAGVPDGVATFYDGANPIDSTPFVDGVATLTITDFNAGLHDITALFLPVDAAFNPSGSEIYPHTVLKKTLTVTADPQTITYGDPDPSFTFQYSGGFVSPDTAAVINTPPTCTVVGPHSNANTYPITCSGGADDNYDFTYVAGTLTVEALEITVTPDAGQFKIYGNPDPTLTYQFTPALIGSDAFSGALARDAGVNVGLYNITQGTLALSSNYTLTFAIGVKFEIKKRDIQVTATAGQFKIYDKDPANPTTYAYTVTNGTLVSPDAFTGGLARAAGENVGLYAINAGSLAINDGNGGGNYNLTFVTADFEIKKRDVEVTATAGQFKIYDKDPANPTTYAYSTTSGSLVLPDAFTGGLARAAGENVGLYAINQGTLAINDGNSGGNYNLTFVGADFEIKKRDIQVTATAGQFKTYGDADPASFTYSITSGLLVSPDAFTGALSRVAGENAGFYAITIGSLAINDGNSGLNYNLSFVSNDFEIKKRLATWTTNPNSKTYGDPEPSPLTTGSGSNFVAADNVTATYSRVSGENASPPTYHLTATLSATGDLNNYIITNTGAEFTINKRLATWTTNPASKTYGDADPVGLTTGSGSNFVAGDNVTATYSRAAGESASPPTYHITATLSATPLSALDNYIITNDGAEFTINKRLATWTTNPASKTYGDLDPSPLTTGSGSNFVPADGVTATYSRVAGEQASPPTYHITATLSATGDLDNYIITNDGAEFTINKRLATWTTDPASKTYGDLDPVPLTTGAGSNFVPADGVTATYARVTGEQASPPTYHITATLSATGDLSNYIITNDGAEFTINKRLATWTTDPNSKTYGDADPVGLTTGSGSNFVAADNVTATYTRVAGEAASPPTYHITATLSATPLSALDNYVITNDGAEFTINKRLATWTTNPNSKTYGDVDPIGLTTGSGSNFVAADNVTATYSRVAGENASPPTYHIAATLSAIPLSALDNYVVTNAGAEFTIDKRELIITAVTNSKTYDGDTDAAAIPTVSGLQFSDSVTGLTEVYDNRNAGNGKTLSVATYTVNDGNGGNNYTVTTVDDQTGVIIPATLTLTALANSRVYNGLTNAAAIPTVGGLISPDTVTGLTETYDNKHVGTGKTMSVATYTINDGNSGMNYDVQTVQNHNGVITEVSLTITAVTNTKTYNGNTSAAAIPTVSGTQTGDSVTGLTETYDTKHFGSGKTLSVATYTVNDGNGGNNYNVSTVPNNTGVINKLAIVVTAVGWTKPFDGNTSSAGVPTIAPPLVGGDASNFIQTYDTPFVGTGKTLTPSGTANDGNSGLNYSYTFTPVNTGVITTILCFNGFHSPVGGSVEGGNGGSFGDPVKAFKLNSTIPFKFTIYSLGCTGSPITTGIHTLKLTKYSNATDSDTAIDATPTDAATTGNQFRLTGTDWHFNLDTKRTPGVTAGTWLVEATLLDGSKKTVWISIKK